MRRHAASHMGGDERIVLDYDDVRAQFSPLARASNGPAGPSLVGRASVDPMRQPRRPAIQFQSPVYGAPPIEAVTTNEKVVESEPQSRPRQVCQRNSLYVYNTCVVSTRRSLIKLIQRPQIVRAIQARLVDGRALAAKADLGQPMTPTAGPEPFDAFLLLGTEIRKVDITPTNDTVSRRSSSSIPLLTRSPGRPRGSSDGCR